MSAGGDEKQYHCWHPRSGDLPMLITVIETNVSQLSESFLGVLAVLRTLRTRDAEPLKFTQTLLRFLI